MIIIGLLFLLSCNGDRDNQTDSTSHSDPQPVDQEIRLTSDELEALILKASKEPSPVLVEDLIYSFDNHQSIYAQDEDRIDPFDQTCDDRCYQTAHEGLSTIEQKLAGLIAFNGGEQAREFLENLYDSVLKVGFTPPEPPYQIDHDSYLDYFNHDSGYCEIKQKKGDGAISRDIIYVLADGQIIYADGLNKGGTIEHCWYTGLTHPAWSSSPIGMHCSLDRVNIEHRMLFEETRLESEILYDDLKLDSDGDGYTDIFERYAFLDPGNPDTDGDGLNDSSDASPNVNPADIDTVSRGIARALKYRYNLRGDSVITPAWESHPTHVAFLVCDRPVIFSNKLSSISICLHPDDLSNHVGTTKHHFREHTPHIKVYDRDYIDGVIQEAAELARQAPSEGDYKLPYFGGDEKDTNRDFYIRFLPDYALVYEVSLIVEITEGEFAAFIPMKAIDGEHFPVDYLRKRMIYMAGFHYY